VPVLIATKRETRLQEVRPPATTGMGKGEGARGPRQKTIQGVKGQTCSIVIQGKGEIEKSNTTRAIAAGNQARKNPARGQNWTA